MAVTITTADLSKGGAVVETSGGTKYAVLVDSNVLVVYKNIDIEIPRELTGNYSQIIPTFYASLAQAFTATKSSNITAVTLRLNSADSPDGTLYVRLRSTLGGADLSSGSIAASSVTGSGDYEFDLTDYGLTQGLTYYLVLEWPDRTQGTITWYSTESNNAIYTGGYAWYKPNGAWYEDPLDAFRFIVTQDGLSELADSDTAATVHGGDNIAWCHAAIDSNDDIHIVCQCDADQTRDVSYAVFDCGTDTLGAWEEAAGYTQQAPISTPFCQISIDSSDQPHIIYVDNVKIQGGNTDQIYYTYNDGSWQGPEQVNATASKDDHMRYPTLTHCPADDVEAIYYDVTAGDPTYRRREIGVGWDTENAYAEGGGNTKPEFGGVTCTTGDTVYRYHHVNDWSLEENNVDTGQNRGPTFVYRASPTLDGTTRYLFFVDGVFEDVWLISNDGGGWTDEGALQVGTYDHVLAQYSYLNNNQADELSYLFDDGTYVYYGSFSLLVAVRSRHPAMIFQIPALV